jgi:hypothetical protein
VNVDSSSIKEDVHELKRWRKEDADPKIKEFDKVLFKGEGTTPSLLVTVASIESKFNTIIAMIAVIGSLLVLIQAIGPWVRQKMGMPIAITLPYDAPKKSVELPQVVTTVPRNP